MDKLNINDNDIYIKIKNYVQEYKKIILIINNYSWIDKTDSISNGEYYDIINENCHNLLVYESALASVLMDYGDSNELKDYLFHGKEYRDIIRNILTYIQNNKNIIISGNFDEFNNNYKDKIINILEKYKNIINYCNMNLFYVNLLITLNLINYKTNYLFDTDILNTFNYPGLKKYAMQKFANIVHHNNEIDLIKYKHLNFKGKDYFFSVIQINGHALLLMVDDIKYYICDLNHLNFIVINDHTYFIANNNFGPQRYSHTFYDIAKKLINLNKIKQVSLNNGDTLDNVCIDITKLYNACIKNKIINNTDNLYIINNNYWFTTNRTEFNKLCKFIEKYITNNSRKYSFLPIPFKYQASIYNKSYL